MTRRRSRFGRIRPAALPIRREVDLAQPPRLVADGIADSESFAALPAIRDVVAVCVEFGVRPDLGAAHASSPSTNWWRPAAISRATVSGAHSTPAEGIDTDQYGAWVAGLHSTALTGGTPR